MHKSEVEVEDIFIEDTEIPKLSEMDEDNPKWQAFLNFEQNITEETNKYGALMSRFGNFSKHFLFLQWLKNIKM